MRVRVYKAWDHAMRPTWFADLNGVEVAAGCEFRGMLTWYVDDDVDDRMGFWKALNVEIDRLARHGYTSSDELDRHLREGRVASLDN